MKRDAKADHDTAVITCCICGNKLHCGHKDGETGGQTMNHDAKLDSSIIDLTCPYCGARYISIWVEGDPPVRYYDCEECGHKYKCLVSKNAALSVSIKKEGKADETRCSDGHC